jgi:hypothetical protein
MSKYIDKGTMVRIRTTNGGDSIVKLMQDYRPSCFAVEVETTLGRPYVYVMLGQRIKSIEVSNTYWTPALTEREIADILAKREAARIADARAMRWAA